MAILRMMGVLVSIFPLTSMAMAQASPAFNLTASPATLSAPAAPSGLGAMSVPGLPGEHPFQAPVQPGPVKFSIKPFGSADARADILTQIMSRSRKAIAMSRDQGSVCYAMRSYDFSVVEPSSDATRMSGGSTCRPAMSARLRAIEDPRQDIGR